MEVRIVNDTEARLELAFAGRLDTNGVDAISTKFYGLVDNLRKSVVIDFSDVVYISSAGIRLLLSGWKMVTKDGFRLYLTDAKPEIIEILKMTGLQEMLL